MARPLTNNPIGVSDSPNLVSDPVREAELVSKFQQVWNDILWSFRNARSTEASWGTINDSVVRVARAVKRKRLSKAKQVPLHPLVALRINQLAREIAVAESGHADAVFDETHVKKAGVEFAKSVSSKRGRPADQSLWNHVELLMALTQHFVGKPVLARRSEGSDYRMFLEEPMAKRIFEALHNVDPVITEAQVADIIVKLRKKYAGKDMNFSELANRHGLHMLTAFRKSGFDAPVFGGVEHIFPIYSP